MGEVAGVAGNPTLFKPKVPTQSTSVSEPTSRNLEIQTEEVTAAQLQPTDGKRTWEFSASLVFPQNPYSTLYSEPGEEYKFLSPNDFREWRSVNAVKLK